MIRTCPGADALQEMLAGSLTVECEQSLCEHIANCSECQRRLDALTAAPDLSIGRAVPTIETPPDPRFIRQLQYLDPGRLDPEPLPKSELTPVPRLVIPEVPGYEILRELGRGGMGVVYLARHRLLGRPVAVKMIPTELYPSDADRAQFQAEAEAIAKLRHPNVVEVYEFGETQARSYLVLEYADGGTLRDHTFGQPQSPRQAAELLELLAGGVQAAHDQQIAHRDLKPGNVLLFRTSRTGSGDGDSSSPLLSEFTPKIGDFGVARRLDTTDLFTRSLVGSPAYMAPEQVPDDDQRTQIAVGPAADIHALGVMLCELLTGRPPYLGADWLTVLFQIRRRDPIPPRQLIAGISVDLQTICLKCLNKEPSQRCVTAAALADDLRRFLDGRPIVARPIGPIPRHAVDTVCTTV